MAEKSTNNSTMEEFERLLQDKDFRELCDLSRHETPVSASESVLSAITTPDPLNTAFINETYVDEQHIRSNLSQQQSQTTKETSSTIHGLIDTILEQEHEILDLRMPKTPTMKSTATMPKTPKMVSTGTMPKTPTMVSTGTMPKTPTMVSTGTMPKTPTMVSTGTMPKTPTMVSTGTMPQTPAMKSTGTMPQTPTTIDLVSPTTETIDLCSPDTPTNRGSPNSTPNIAPQ